MSTLFISDLHLDNTNIHTTQLFLDFMNHRASTADKLYILGDLFEVWLGDDHCSAFTKTIRSSIEKIAQKIPVFFMHGNRDFLLGSRFASDTGCTLLPEATVIDLYGTPTLLMHGDALCIDDLPYQKARRKMHDPVFCAKLLSYPLWIRKAMAFYYRYQSKKHTTQSRDILMDANPAEIKRVMALHDIHLLIHGHTHRPGMHLFRDDGQVVRQRIVLSDWGTLGNVLVCHPNGEKSLEYFNVSH